MTLKDTFKICVQSLTRNKMRSFLTSLGIIIGMASVIIMMAVGEGSQKEIEKQIETMGTNFLQIMPQHTKGPDATLNPALLTKTDLQKIKDEAVYVTEVSGVVQGSFTVRADSNSGAASVYGVEENYGFIKNREIGYGSFFDKEDCDAFRCVAVVGTDTANFLFGSAENAPGKTFQLGNNIFTVKGVLKPLGTSGGRSQDELIWIPLSTFQARISNAELSNISVSVRSKELLAKAEKDITAILREAHGLTEKQKDNFSIMNSADILAMASSTAKTLTTLLAAIAAVSLVVGGIGIMNIMLVSVTERIREIGILMSIGAAKGDVLSQFLSEAAVLSFAGGIAGIIFSLLACFVLGKNGVAVSINPFVIFIAALISVLEGIFFGFYPAWKASSLRPIEALRFE
ncbi:MAG: ABC transporter permease [Treponema sp.]